MSGRKPEEDTIKFSPGERAPSKAAVPTEHTQLAFWRALLLHGEGAHWTLVGIVSLVLLVRDQADRF